MEKMFTKELLFFFIKSRVNLLWRLFIAICGKLWLTDVKPLVFIFILCVHYNFANTIINIGQYVSWIHLNFCFEFYDIIHISNISIEFYMSRFYYPICIGCIAKVFCSFFLRPPIPLPPFIQGSNVSKSTQVKIWKLNFYF